MTPHANPVTFPHDVTERVERVLEFHRTTKQTHESVRQEARPDPKHQPNPFRVFDSLPKIPLPSNLHDVPAPTVALMEQGFEAIPDSLIAPPQNLKTLATWLHMAAGITSKRQMVGRTEWTRACTSNGHAFPSEIYVAAFAIEGLEPGLYHYSIREYALRKMRDGAETLARMKRGRPDLEFLKTVPLAMLVSTIFCRSSWQAKKRGYRDALHDAGHLIQNLITVATGLGVQTLTRLQINDATTRELIGLAPDADYGSAEAVQAMVVWADQAKQPMTIPARGAGPSEAMPPIRRGKLADEIVHYGSIVATHQDCVAPGVGVREVRPPLTELTPLPPNFHTFEAPPAEEVPTGLPLRQVVLTKQSGCDFSHRAIPRDEFMTINRLAFRGGAFFPLHPDGPHVALVRPMWLIHDVTGMDSGVWYYHPPTDAWSMLRSGEYRDQAAYLCLEQPAGASATAVCFLMANLHTLLTNAGPDLYRLAHLEAGLVAQRVILAALGLELAAGEIGNFYDDEVRQFLGLRQTGWEILYAVAIGTAWKQGEDRLPAIKDGLQWRD